MNRRGVEVSREIRLWTTTIVAPIILIGISLAANKDVRNWVKKKILKKEEE